MEQRGEYYVLDAEGLDNYKFLTASVIPRPIAWVSTWSESGSVNVAPFSFYTVASPEPPTVLFSIGGHGLKTSGEEKDTLANLRKDPRVTISQVDSTLLDQMVATAAEFDEGIDEFAEANLDAHESVPGYPPMMAGAPGALFGRLTEFIEVGKSFLALCRIERYVFRADLFDGRHVDYQKVQVVARLGGPYYAGMGEVKHSSRVSPEEVGNRFAGD